MNDIDESAKRSMRPTRARIHEDHVASEGIEAHWTSNEKKALGILCTGLTTVVAKVLIRKLKEQNDV